MLPPKYYAIRVHHTIVIRRTLVGLRRIVSVLTNPQTSFVLRQTTYTGGSIVGVVSYVAWIQHGGPTIVSFKRIDRSLVRSMKPFLLRNE